jgi:hypothetical protein
MPEERVRLPRLMPSCVFTIAGLVGGCGGTEPSNPVALVAAPEAITLSDVQPRGTLFLSTEPSGGRLEWELVAKPAWLTIAADHGVIDDEVVSIAVEAQGTDTLPPGDIWGQIELISNGGTAGVAVMVSIQAHPAAELSTATLAIAETTDTAVVTLRNGGSGTLVWSLSPTPAWLTVDPASGYLEQGQSVELRVVPDRATLPVGTTETSITVVSNADAGDVVLPITVTVSSAPEAEISVGRLGYPQGVSERVFWLRNPGRGVLTWQAEIPVTWLELSPSSGEIGQGDSVALTATVTRASVPTGGSTTLTLNSDAIGGAVALPVLVTTAAGFEPGLTVLNHRVLDAEASPAADLLVTVSADPNQLHILDLVAGTTTMVALSLPPTCVAVRPDGAFAAVGHDGSMSLVDLRTGAVTRVYTVSTVIHDLVLASNGWAYAFPSADQWVELHNIEVATGLEVANGWLLYEKAQARLHPSGRSIYTATTQLSPSDFEKYDISKGVGERLYDSPYHGDYEFGGDIWISADGTRLFARSGNVFRSSSAPEDDMRYGGALAGSGLVRGVSDTRALPRIFVLGESTPADLRVYDQSNLAFRGAAPLPGFPNGGATVTAEGRFVFTSLAGDRVYVLAQAEAGAGLALDWGLVTLETGSLP